MTRKDCFLKRKIDSKEFDIEKNDQIKLSDLNPITKPYLSRFGCSYSIHQLKLNSSKPEITIQVKLIFNDDPNAQDQDIIDCVHEELVIMKRLNNQFVCHLDASQIDFSMIDSKNTKVPTDKCDRYVSRLFDCRFQSIGQSSDSNDQKRTLAMFFENNQSLSEIIQSANQLDERQILFILLQVALAIRYIHSLQVVHRDLKLESLQIDRENRVFLSEFGEARYLPDQLHLEFTDRQISRGGSGIPPEIKKSRAGKGVKLDYSKTDVWALGNIAYQLFNLPFPYAHVKGDSKDEDLVEIQQASKQFNHLVKKLLAHDFSQRLSINQAIDRIYGCLWPFEVIASTEDCLSSWKRTEKERLVKITQSDGKLSTQDCLLAEFIQLIDNQTRDQLRIRFASE